MEALICFIAFAICNIASRMTNTDSGYSVVFIAYGIVGGIYDFYISVNNSDYDSSVSNRNGSNRNGSNKHGD